MWLHRASMGSCAHPAMAWTVLLFSRQFDPITATLRDLNELSKWAEIIGCPSEEEALQQLWVLGEKHSITQKENPNKSCFLWELPPCSQPACWISLYSISFTGLLAEAHLCAVFQQCKSSCFPKPEKTHLTRHAQGRAGREPSWLWDIATHPHKQTQNAASLPACHSFHFFCYFHSLYVSQWLRQKRKIKHRERK